MSKAVFEFLFSPAVFLGIVFVANVAIFVTMERLWGERRIDWREVLLGDVTALVFTTLVVVAAARQLDRLVDMRGPWPESIKALPFAARLALYLLVADFGAYWVHRLAHVRPLWRIHRWHHAPTHMYWLVGARTSILQQALFNAPYIFASPLLDISPWWIANALLIFYMLTNSWMHMNVGWRLRGLDWLFVTPRTHHIHHSDQPSHYQSNFGVILTVWDRMFGTFSNPDDVDPNAIRYGIGERVPVARLAIGL